eukprot:c12006_g2_i1.p1 GENE.c12006_g2_i1~~c12006_g2_i1.p1  ORF type:complete len:218 (+),score=50.68 c12006_g2_i1:30-656(+)
MSSSSSSSASDEGAAMEHMNVVEPLQLPGFYEIVAAYCWTFLDVDQNGSIDVDEWVNGVAKITPDSDPAKVRADLVKFDQDHSGSLNFSEFTNFMNAWDQSGQTHISEAACKKLTDLKTRFAGAPATVNWETFLELARVFVPQARESVAMDEAFGRSLLLSVGIDAGLVNTLTYGEALIALTALWHGPPQAHMVAFYYKNACAKNGRH